MKYVATVEIEYEAEENPLEVLHRVMRRAGDDTNRTDPLPYRYYIEHYHIVEQPRELK